MFYKHSIKSISNLLVYASNARTHSDEQVAQIAASIKEWGFTNPILIDEESTIIAGHGRVLAAKKLGITEVPCVTLAGLTEGQKKAYVIADNKLASNAGWDDAMLGAELQSLDEMAFDLSIIGFSESELAERLSAATVGKTDENEVPDAPETPITQPGDVWVLGKHRLVCGDCTDPESVDKCLNGVEPHLMVTDPPYGVDYDPDWRNRVDRANGKPYGGRAIGKVINDSRADWSEAYALFPGDVCYVWHPPGALQIKFYQSLVDCGFNIRMQIIWSKSHFPIGRGNYHVQHEPCWYAVRKKSGATAHWQGDRKQSTIWNINKPMKSETGHSTTKPVECMRRPIENNSSPGQAVYEPFSGSGTTIIAAEQTGRACHAIEISPAYVDVAIKRWQDFTGQDAVREGDGLTFMEVSDGGQKAASDAA